MAKEKPQNITIIIEREKEALAINSDADFARMIGILPSTLTNWRSKNTLNVPLLLSKCLNISIDWLINGIEKQMIAPENSEQISGKQTDQYRICLVKNQIKEINNLFHEKLEHRPLTYLLVEIPLFMHLVPDDPYKYPENIVRYLLYRNSAFGATIPPMRSGCRKTA